MPSPLSFSRFADHLRPGSRVYLPGGAAHSPLFERWLRDAAERCVGVWFGGVWIPGINRFDPSSLHAQASASSFFISKDLQAGWQRGAVHHLPLHYSEAERWLATPGRFNLVLLQLAPPDELGRCSLSISCDFAPAVMAGLDPQAVVLAHINPHLPRTSGPWVALEHIDAWVEEATPLLTVPPERDDVVLNRVAERVAALVHDGDTLQLGLGRLQAAVLARLHGHRHLRLHGGMVSDGVLGLADTGALAPPHSTQRGAASQAPLCAGLALGSHLFYQRVADPDDPAFVQFAPVGHTHGQATLAALPRLLAINSALEIDLLGQVNCEWLHGQVCSGVGGLVDFVRGARASVGGRAVIAASAEVVPKGNNSTGGGKASASPQVPTLRSRIVPLLAPGTVSLARSDVDIVVTEHGAASLRNLDIDARAHALINIAAPNQRETLAQAWHTLRSHF